MQAYRTQVQLTEDGKLILTAVPFRAGESVEVIVLPSMQVPNPSDLYPLRGNLIHYDNPTDPVDTSDWEATK